MDNAPGETQLRWKRGLVFFITLTVLCMPLLAFGDAKAQQAEQKLRGYFEFPRRPLEERDYAGLSIPCGVLKATPERPAVIRQPEFTYVVLPMKVA